MLETKILKVSLEVLYNRIRSISIFRDLDSDLGDDSKDMIYNIMIY